MPNERCPNGETPLMMASRTGNVDAMKVLLDRGADVNATEKLRGTTALMWAREPAAISRSGGADPACSDRAAAPNVRRRASTDAGRRHGVRRGAHRGDLRGRTAEAALRQRSRAPRPCADEQRPYG